MSSSATAASAQDPRPMANGSKPEAVREFTVSQPSLETAKSRIEEVLGRMKSTVEQINPTAAPRGTEAGAEAETEERPRSDDSVYADLENRKSQIILAVRAAEEKAREAELAFKQLEQRLEEEVAKRKVAEDRLIEVEEGLAQQVSALEVLGIKRMEAESALEQQRSRLSAEHEVRSKLENEIFEARSQADAFSLKLVKLENLKTDAESKAAAAESIVREVEAMVFQSESLANEAFEKFKALEADLAREVELRLFAEQQLKDLVEGVNFEAAPIDPASAEVRVAVEPPPPQIISLAEDQRKELEQEIEAQREARRNAEQKLGAVESETKTLKEQLTAETRTLKEQFAVETRNLKEQLTKANEKHNQLETKQRDLLKARDADQNAVKTRKSELEQLQARLRTAEATLKSKDQLLAEAITERDRLKNAPPVAPAPAEGTQQRKMRIVGLSAGIIVLIVIIVILAVAALQQL